MNKAQFKNVLVQYAKGMCDKYFDSNSFQDIISKALACTFINANIDKYDNYLDYFSDNNGQILIEEFLDNVIDNFKPYQLDLTKYNVPFLPNKILLIGKQDLLLFKNMCMSCNYDTN